ncbi:MAG: hypothetical protein L0226_11555 [Acidobacteria bacterium]|nr:hypothetical protein [Acidobacteriota bacterium]MCI0666059.1 hypothetical protein [Acidobacteriota bacterium]
MKKAFLAVCCFVSIAFIVSGLRTTKAIIPQQPNQVVETTGTSLATDLSIQDMTLRSDLILTGQCIETRSTWIERSLVTLATISVSERIKGDSSSTVQVVIPGGVDANRQIPIAMTYPGAPSIRPQEEVFLFLTAADGMSTSYSVMGYAQGKLSIVEDDQGQKLVSRDLTRVRLKSGEGVVRGNVQWASLAEFKERIKGYLR